jgi:Potential Queuosine, Q, salvage protein family
MVDESIQCRYNQGGRHEAKGIIPTRGEIGVTDSSIKTASYQDNPFKLIEPDDLGVLGSTRWVVEHADNVWINRDRLERVCHEFLTQYTPPSEATWYERFHFHDGTERTVNWLLILDALNFCFWAEKGQPRWRIDYQSEILDGYWAEAAALTRAVEEGIALWDARYLSSMSREDLAHIFRSVPAANGTAGAMIPLFEQRLEHVHEVGRVLLERYDGQFAHAVEHTGGDAVKLALLLVQDFSSFRDIAFYRGREVRFFKRAQICVADLHGAFGGKRWGAFTNLDKLTIFADYKLPQVLRHYDVLAYHANLAERVDNQELLEPGREAEVELRAATIWACELLRREMSHAAGREITAVEIDQLLWYLGQNASGMRPYHRTRTIYY